QLHEQLVRAAAVSQQRGTHQVKEVLEAQYVFVASSAMRLPDRMEKRVIEDEITDFKHTPGQRRSLHQLPFKRIHAKPPTQHPSATGITCQEERGWGAPALSLEYGGEGEMFAAGSVES